MSRDRDAEVADEPHALDSRSPITVLHVDDDPGFGELVATFLEREDDLTVERAGSADEALDVLHGRSIDCVVSDYQMPGTDGLDLLASVRERYGTLPFVLFTGQGSETIASDAISAGVTDYLQKGGGPGQFAVLVNRIRNLVENDRVQRELSEHEAHFQLLAETAPVGIVTTDEAGTVKFANRAVDSIFGHPPSTLVGTSLDRIVAEGDRERFRVWLERFTGTDDPVDGSTSVDLTGVHAEGHQVDLVVSLFELVNGGATELTVIVHDVTERVRREQKFRAVFERAFDAMVIANDDGEYVDANAAACDLFGLSRADLLGCSISDFTPLDYDFAAAWRRFEASERERGLFPLVRADGAERTVEFAATRDVVPGWHLSVLRDVTDRMDAAR